MEVTLPAFAEDVANRAWAGALIAIWSAGSALGGLWYGARAWRSGVAERYVRLAWLLPLGYLPLAAAPSLAAMVPLCVLAGVAIAPLLTAGNQLVGEVAPRGRADGGLHLADHGARHRAGRGQRRRRRGRRGGGLARGVPRGGRRRGARRGRRAGRPPGRCVAA